MTQESCYRIRPLNRAVSEKAGSFSIPRYFKSYSASGSCWLAPLHRRRVALNSSNQVGSFGGEEVLGAETCWVGSVALDHEQDGVAKKVNFHEIFL